MHFSKKKLFLLKNFLNSPIRKVIMLKMKGGLREDLAEGLIGHGLVWRCANSWRVANTNTLIPIADLVRLSPTCDPTLTQKYEGVLIF